MTKKISFFVVTVAAVTLVLSGCGKGPGMDMPDEHGHGADMPMSARGIFAGFARCDA